MERVSRIRNLNLVRRRNIRVSAGGISVCGRSTESIGGTRGTLSGRSVRDKLRRTIF
jgi:hypothetical protein